MTDVSGIWNAVKSNSKMFRNALSIAVGALIALGAVTPGVAQQNAPYSPKPQALGTGTYDAPFAQAVAYIGQAGAVVGSKGFASATHPSVGVECLKLNPELSVQTAPVVSIEWGASAGVVLFAQWVFRGGSCPDGTDIEVQTYKGDMDGVGSGYQTPVLSDQVAYSIVVP